MVRLDMGCGGTLISDRHVLTAFHCVQHIVESGNNWDDHWVKVSVHDQYDSSDYQKVYVKTALYPSVEEIDQHDIAIIVLKKKVTWDESIRPACLPQAGDIHYVGEEVTALGWGRHTVGDTSQSRYLRQVDLEVASSYYINNNFLLTEIRRVGDVVLEVCRGDSGGPLLHQDTASNRWTVIGTVYAGSYDCYRGTGENGVSIWNKVTAHLSWINSILAQDSSTQVCHPPAGPRVDGAWTSWSSWSDCSASCGGGLTKRRRTCTNPPPNGGGNDCNGTAVTTEVCGSEECPPLPVVELRGGSGEAEGNVYVNGRPVCDDYWVLADAKVVCSMLGLTALTATTYSHFGNAVGEYIMDDVRCEGIEETLLDCPHSSEHNCGAHEAAGVVCGSNTVTLVGGSTENEGNVFIDGFPVCDDYWGTPDGQVVCRQLGFSGLERITKRSEFGEVSRVFGMDDVACKGDELNLHDCPHLDKDNCGSHEGAGVVCLSGVTLVGGNSSSSGNLVIDGKFVCDDNWDRVAAGVVCRQLGFLGAKEATTHSWFGLVGEDFKMDDIKCTGEEVHIMDCDYRSDDNCDGKEGAGVICETT